MYVHIFHDEAENAITLPRTPLFRGENGAWNVMIVRDGRTELRPVTVGLMNDNLAEITKGLTPKDVVVARPSRKITAGMRVETNKME